MSSQLGVAKSEQEDLEEKLMDLEKDFNEVKTNYQALEQKLEDAKNENSFFKTNLITLKKVIKKHQNLIILEKFINFSLIK